MVRFMRKILTLITFFVCAFMSFDALDVNASTVLLEGPMYNEMDDFSNLCADFSPALRIGGLIIYAVKILLPVIIIFKATFSLFSTVTKGDAGEFKKKTKKLGFSLLSGVLIFFVPTFVYAVFGFIESFDKNMSKDAKVCAACVFDPFDEICTDSVESVKNK